MRRVRCSGPSARSSLGACRPVGFARFLQGSAALLVNCRSTTASEKSRRTRRAPAARAKVRPRCSGDGRCNFSRGWLACRARCMPVCPASVPSPAGALGLVPRPPPPPTHIQGPHPTQPHPPATTHPLLPAIADFAEGEAPEGAPEAVKGKRGKAGKAKGKGKPGRGLEPGCRAAAAGRVPWPAHLPPSHPPKERRGCRKAARKQCAALVPVLCTATGSPLTFLQVAMSAPRALPPPPSRRRWPLPQVCSSMLPPRPLQPPAPQPSTDQPLSRRWLPLVSSRRRRRPPGRQQQQQQWRGKQQGALRPRRGSGLRRLPRSRRQGREWRGCAYRAELAQHILGVKAWLHILLSLHPPNYRPGKLLLRARSHRQRSPCPAGRSSHHAAHPPARQSGGRTSSASQGSSTLCAYPLPPRGCCRRCRLPPGPCLLDPWGGGGCSRSRRR